MISYAARKSWDFDFICRKYLDESYFEANENQDCETRLGLLLESQTKVMEVLVARKMDESKNREIVKWG